MSSSASDYLTPNAYARTDGEHGLSVVVETKNLPLSEQIEHLEAEILALNREHTKIQNLLGSLSFALRRFNNLNQFLELTPLMSARVVDAEGGVLVTFDPQGHIQSIRVYCSKNSDQPLIRQAFEHARANLPSTPSDDAISAVQWITKLDEQVQTSLGKEIKLYSTAILVKNVHRGKLYVFGRDACYRHNVERRRLLQLVADQTAVAIANNDLNRKLRSKEKQDRELKIAAQIQTHLLPRECPQIRGLAIAAACRNAYHVGGDYYDFIPTNYDRIRRQDDPKAVQCVPWSIVIGDVMGKGVPAGLIMTMTRGLLRAEVLNQNSPAEILTHLNRVMYADLDNSHRFVTLFYSEYDPRSRTLAYSNAAHHPPLLWRAQSKQIESLDTEGMLIGLDLDSEYEGSQVTLEVGDTILYYTDGLTDAVNAHGDRFDEANLHKIFQDACQTCETPTAIVKTLFTQVEAFIYPKHHSSDDMTVVVLQVQPEGIHSFPCP